MKQVEEKEEEGEKRFVEQVRVDEQVRGRRAVYEERKSNYSVTN